MTNIHSFITDIIYIWLYKLVMYMQLLGMKQEIHF